MADIGSLLLKIKSQYDDKGTKEATTDVKALEGATGGLSESLVSLAGPAAAAAAIIAAAGLAAAATARAIFDLAKTASDFGSALKDVQDKTGLTAETLSTLKLNAEQSGSSLEKVGGSVAKFNVLLGQAENGNKKAQQTLAQYGVTAHDTDTALQQAVKTIGNMGEASQQAAASAALFKDKTGEMLPVIKQMNGDLAAATEETKKLGLAMSQDALEQADALGDQLTVLDAQLKMVEVTIGTALIPTVLDLARTFSSFLSENKADIASWASAVGFTVHNVVLDIREFISNLRAAASIAGKIAAGDYIGAAGDAVGGAIDFNNLDKSRNTRGAFGSAGGRLGGGGGTSPGGGGGSRGGGGGAKDDRLARIKEADAEILKERQAMVERDIAWFKAEVAAGNAIEEDRIAFTHQKELELSDFKIALLKSELKEIGSNAKERIRLTGEIAVETTKQETLLEKQREENIKFSEKQKDDVYKKGLARRAAILKQQKEDADQDAKENEEGLKLISEMDQAQHDSVMRQIEDNRRLYLEKKQHAADLRDNPIGLLLGQFQNNAGATAVIESLADAFSQLGQAVGQTVEALVLYGNAGGNLRQVTAKILAAVASQAAVKAVFELAEGLACLALAFFGDPAAGAAATMHFAAAAAYGSIAAVAGLAGRAVAGDSFKQGASASGGRGSAGASSNTSPQSRVGATATDSGLRGTLDRLNSHLDRLEPMSAGDVLVKGTQQKPDHVLKSMVHATGAFPALAKQMTVRQGIR